MTQLEHNAAFDAAQAGDNDAFTKLFDAYWEMVYYNCLKRLRNEHDAEDAVQEVFIILYRRISKLKGPEHLARGLQYYALEVCSNYYSKAKRTPAGAVISFDDLQSEPEAPREEFLPEAVLEHKELKEEILALVDKLPKKQREIVFNYYFNGFSAVEIAAVMQLSANAVGNRLHKARLKLAELAEKRLGPKEALMSAFVPVLTRLFQENMGIVALSSSKPKMLFGLEQRLIVETVATPLRIQGAFHSSVLGTKIVISVATATACACIFGAYSLNAIEDAPPPLGEPPVVKEIVIRPPPAPVVVLPSVTLKYYLNVLDDDGYMGEDYDEVFEDREPGSIFAVTAELRNKHMPEGYEYVGMESATGSSIDGIIEVDGSGNEIRVLYAKPVEIVINETSVTIKYYMDTFDDAGYMGESYDEVIDGLTPGATFTMTGELRDKHLPIGYVCEIVTSVYGDEVSHEGENEIKVFYARRSDLSVTIRYYLDTLDNQGYMGTRFDQVVSGLTFGSTYSITNALRSMNMPEGYIFNRTDPASGGVTVAVSGNEIRVVFVKPAVEVLTSNVTIRYYLDVMDSAGYMGSSYDRTISGLTVGSTYRITSELRDVNIPEGYRFGNMGSGGGNVEVAEGGSEIQVLYTRRSDLAVTVRYYKDTIDAAGYLGDGFDAVISGLTYGATYTVSNDVRDRFMPEGYRFDRMDAPTGSIQVAVSGNVIRVLYTKIGDLASARVTYFSTRIMAGSDSNFMFSVHITLADGSSFTVDHAERVDETSKGNVFFLYNTIYGDYTVFAAWNDDLAVTACEIREFIPAHW